MKKFLITISGVSHEDNECWIQQDIERCTGGMPGFWKLEIRKDDDIDFWFSEFDDDYRGRNNRNPSPRPKWEEVKEEESENEFNLDPNWNFKKSKSLQVERKGRDTSSRPSVSPYREELGKRMVQYDQPRNERDVPSKTSSNTSHKSNRRNYSKDEQKAEGTVSDRGNDEQLDEPDPIKKLKCDEILDDDWLYKNNSSPININKEWKPVTQDYMRRYEKEHRDLNSILNDEDWAQMNDEYNSHVDQWMKELDDLERLSENNKY